MRLIPQAVGCTILSCNAFNIIVLLPILYISFQDTIVAVFFARGNIKKAPYLPENKVFLDNIANSFITPQVPI